jgi:hypothetical protein
MKLEPQVSLAAIGLTEREYPFHQGQRAEETEIYITFER